DQLPDGQALIERKGFKNMGDVGRVQLIEFALQLGKVLPMHQVLDPVLVLTLLAMGQALDQLVAMQQIDHLSQAILQAFLRLFGFYFSHTARSTPAAGRAAGSISQNAIGRKANLSNYWVSPWWLSTSLGEADLTSIAPRAVKTRQNRTQYKRLQQLPKQRQNFFPTHADHRRTRWRAGQNNLGW